MSNLERINKVIEENREYYTIKKLANTLGKYKKALDIFKRLLDDDFTYGGFDDGRLLIDGAIDITDDEEELLKELINNEN